MADSCATCNGRGFVPVPRTGILGGTLKRTGCPACNPEPEIFTSLMPAPGDNRIAGVAGNAARSLVEFYSVPENQAFLAGCIIGAGIRGGRMRPVPGVLFTMACGLMAREAYRVAMDIHAIRAAGDARPPVA